MHRLLVTALAVAAVSAPPPATAAEALAVERITTAGGGGANSYLIDAGGPVVVVDGQATLSLGAALARRAVATGQPVGGILVTHPHPDHVGGLSTLERITDAPIYASSEAAVEMEADTRKLLGLARKAAPDDTAAPPHPAKLVRDGEEFTIGDITVMPMAFGPSEASSTTVYAVPDRGAVFTGDLLTPGTTPFLLEKRTAAWLEQLDRLAGSLPPDTVAYPGHGEPGPLGDLVADQRAYLTAFRDRVSAALADGTVTADEADRIVAETEAAFPGRAPVATIPDLMRRNIVAVAAELAGDRGAPPLATVDTRP